MVYLPYIYHENQPNVGKYAIHGPLGIMPPVIGHGPMMLGPRRRLVLFGHSRGAAPATCVAYRLPERVLGCSKTVKRWGRRKTGRITGGKASQSYLFNTFQIFWT